MEQTRPKPADQASGYGQALRGSASSNPGHASHQPPELTARRRWLALAVLCVPLLIVSLDMTVLNVALPTIARKLDATDSELQWIVDAYVLVLGGLMLVAGSVADRVGRKWTFMTGLAAFAACSTWAAFSGSSGVLIAARASMGVGAALIMPSTLSIITNTFADPLERQKALGVWAGTTGASVALGPIAGGLLLAHFAWGSVFLINVPIALLGLPLAARYVPNSRSDRAEPLDLVGSLLSVAGVGVLLWAIISAPTSGWGSGKVLGGGISGLTLLVVFVLWERRAPYPMLKVSFFRQRSFTGSIASIGLMMFGLVGSLFVLTQFLQFQLGDTALEAGVHMLPAAGGIAVVAPLSAILLRRFGPKFTVSVGLLLGAAGLWQISGVTIASTYSATLAGTLMLGVGVGLVMPACVGTLMGTLPAENTGLGSATNGAFIQIGGALGVAIIGSALSSRYEDRLNAVLAGHAIPSAIRSQIDGSLGGALTVAHHLGAGIGEQLAGASRQAFIDGMTLSLHIGALVGVVGAAIALAVLPLRQSG